MTLTESHREPADTNRRFVVDAGDYFIAEIAEGETMRIVDLEGNQAVDTLFFCDRQGFCEWSSASCG